MIEFLYKKHYRKIIGLVALIVFFTIIYLFLDSSHFQGINPLQDKIKDNIVEKRHQHQHGVSRGDLGRDARCRPGAC